MPKEMRWSLIIALIFRLLTFLKALQLISGSKQDFSLHYHIQTCYWCAHSLLSIGYQGALSFGVKWSGHEADHSPLSSAEVNNSWSYTFIPPYIFLVWCLIKQRVHLCDMVLSLAQGQLYIYFSHHIRNMSEVL